MQSTIQTVYRLFKITSYCPLYKSRIKIHAKKTPRTVPRHEAFQSLSSETNFNYRFAAWQAVMTICPKISSALQPRDKSFNGFRNPCRIGP